MTNHYHSVSFEVTDFYGNVTGMFNTFDDWGLYLTAPVTVSPPNVQTYTVDIPGRNGALDLTEAATGHVSYEDREMEMNLLCIRKKREWRGIYKAVQNAIHGKVCKITCSDDPDYYYKGRVYVGDWEVDERLAYPTITATVEPYKTERNPRVVAVSLDSFTENTTDITGRNVSTVEWAKDIRWGGTETLGYDWSLFDKFYVNWTAYPNAATSAVVTAYHIGGTYESWSVAKTPWTEEIGGTVISDSLDSIYRIKVENVRTVTVTAVASNTKMLRLTGSEKPVCPVVSTDKEIELIADGRSWTIEPGTWRDRTLVLRENGLEMLFKNGGTGATVEVTVNGGCL